MGLYSWGFWQWLAVVQRELLLFAGVFFLTGAIDDVAVDLSWLWLKLTGKAATPKVGRASLQERALQGRAAIFIPAWREADVIADTIDHLLGVWPLRSLRLYVGIYRNDPATLEAAIGGARGDSRLRLVIYDRDGPSTKADCLNRLYRAMCDDERRAGERFSCVVFHDAEDMVDPGGLGMLDWSIAEGSDFAQLPVEPLPQAARHWLGSHYCEEFAEAHGEAMVVRSGVGAALPAAGVGCAVERGMLENLADRGKGRMPFDPDSLTEDYELGLTIAEHSGSCRFVRVRGEDDLLIATRAYFPSKLGHVVSQKTRWIHGIALQGWDRTGWTRGAAESWMRARDRRGPLTALVLLIGYTLLALTLLLVFANSRGLAEPPPLSPALVALLYANLGLFAWRSLMRIPVTIVIAILAGRRAVFAYARTFNGRLAQWDKTPHDRHPTQPIKGLGNLAQSRGGGS